AHFAAAERVHRRQFLQQWQRRHNLIQLLAGGDAYYDTADAALRQRKAEARLHRRQVVVSQKVSVTCKRFGESAKIARSIRGISEQYTLQKNRTAMDLDPCLPQSGDMLPSHQPL